MTDHRKPAAGRHRQDERWDDPDLDRLFMLARDAARRDTAGVDIDVDRVVAVASAAVDARRARRLTALRVGGVALICALLAAWIIGFAVRGVDILYLLVLFAVPAVAVLRWHLQAMDGRGILPWSTPQTVDGWSQEATRRLADLTASVADLDRLASKLDEVDDLVADGHGDGTGRDPLRQRTTKARGDIGVLVARLDGCQDDARRFIDTCASAPNEAEWALLCHLDPSRANRVLDEVVGNLRFAAANAPQLPVAAGDEDAGSVHRAMALRAVQHDAERIRRDLGTRCGGLVQALDRLHHVASERTLHRSETVVGRAAGPMMIAASGWWRPPAQRSVIRNLVLDRARDGHEPWIATIRNARAIARTKVHAVQGAC